VKCCNKSDGITSSGYELDASDAGKICAAPKDFAYGTVIHVSGGWTGTLEVQDRGGAIKGKKLDVYFPTHQQALNFGKKTNCTIKYSQ
jgi:3D (Asp-Asp-Asp) domain-containing protein